MTKTQYALAYETCNNAELQAFLIERDLYGTASAPAYADRQQNVQALREADEQATFRFLDLPPELRDEVYDHLLHVKSMTDLKGELSQEVRSNKCHPKILQRCRQVRNEGEAILYGVANEVVIRIEFRLVPARKNDFFPAVSISVDGARVDLDNPSKTPPEQWESHSPRRVWELSSKPDAPNLWPSRIGKFRIVRLHLSFELPERLSPVFFSKDTANTIRFNHVIYDFGNFLAGHGNLKTLAVFFHPSQHDEKVLAAGEDVMVEMLGSICDRSNVRCNIIGTDGPKAQRRALTGLFDQIMQGEDLVQHTRTIRRRLRTRIEAEENGFAINGGILKTLLTLDDAVVRALECPHFINEASHTCLVNMLAHAEECLRLLSPPEEGQGKEPIEG